MGGGIREREERQGVKMGNIPKFGPVIMTQFVSNSDLLVVLTLRFRQDRNL